MSARGQLTLDARPDSRTFVPPFLSTIAALVLCALVPLVLSAAVGSEPPVDGSWWYAVAVMVIAGGWLAWLFGLGEARLTQLTFWSFTYVFMGMAPLVQMRTQLYPSTTPGLVTDNNEPAMLIVLLGVFAVSAGVVLRARDPSIDAGEAGVREQRVIWLALAALALNAYFVSRVGVGPLLESRTALRAVEFALWPNPTVAALVIAACTMPLLVSFLALMQTNRQRRERGHPALRLLTFLTAAAVLFSVNPISSPRYHFGTVILAVLAGLGMYATKSRVRFMVLATVAGLVFVFPAADAFRFTGSADAGGFDPIASMTTGDFDAFAQINNTVTYVATAGITWGLQALGVLLFWVPRGFWPSKPLDTGVVIAQGRGYDFTNLSAPIWAELYINFGWLAVAVGMFLLGRWMQRFDRRAEALRAIGRVPSTLALILPFYLVILLRGSLLQAMAYLALIVACAWFVRDRRPST